MDVLEKMTKEELIHWIRENALWRRPKMSWVYFYRWNAQSDALAKKQRSHTAALKNMDFKQRDDYAAQFNAATNTGEQLRLLGLIKPYDDKFDAWIKESRRLDKERRQVDALYAKYEKEAERERMAKQ